MRKVIKEQIQNIQYIKNQIKMKIKSNGSLNSKCHKCNFHSMPIIFNVYYYKE